MRSHASLWRTAALALALAAVGRAFDTEGVWQGLFASAVQAVTAKDYGKAEQLFTQAASAADRFGSSDVRAATTYNGLGMVLREEKKYAEASRTFARALTIFEKSSGPESLDSANVNFNMATAEMGAGHNESAIHIIQKASKIYAKILGPRSLKTAAADCLLGDAYRALNKYQDAEGPLKDCADIREAAGGIANPELADALMSLGLVYQHEGKYPQADVRMKLAEKIREQTLGITSPAFAEALEAHANLLKLLGRGKDADRDEAMAAAVRRNDKKKK